MGQRGRPPSNQAVLTHVDLLGGLDCLTASFRHHDFPRHTHADYLIGLIDTGVHDVWCRGEWWHARAGSIATFTPDEPHYGGAGSEAGWSQKILYLPESLVLDLMQDAWELRRDAPGFSAAFHDDPKMVRELRALWSLIETDAPSLEIEETLLQLLPRLFSRYAGLIPRRRRVAPAGVKRARDYIHACFDTAIQLDELAAVADLSKGHLIEGFKTYFGVPPQRYLIQVRIDEARRLLRQGTDIADVACAVGFADQSHLTRHFRAVLGVTPARYVAP
jgi:AraC-like DNA-binding protein